MEQYSVWIMVGIFFLLLIVRVMANNKILKWTAKSGLCSALLVGINMFIPSCAVAINVCTIIFVTILGFPGVMTLYMLKMLVR